MKRMLFARGVVLLAVSLLLAACGGKGSDDDDNPAGAATGVALVTTVMPVQRDFRNEVEAWGSVVADPHSARTISLAHGGQVIRLMVSAGQSVPRGAALLTIAPDPAARSAWQQARSALALARSEWQRTGQLAAQHLATASQLAAAKKALADARSIMAAQQALGGDAAQEIVRAPDAGVVIAVSVPLGERFAANAPLLRFQPAHALLAELGVPPDAGMPLRVGMPVQLHAVYGVAAPLVGKLTMVGRVIDPQSHLVPVQAQLPAAADVALLAGAAVQASIQGERFAAWAVPRAAVLHDEQGTYVFQLDHGKAHRVEVQLRQPQGDTVGVEGPLDAKLPVIVQGAYEVDDGAAVRQGDSQAKSEPKP